MRTKRAPDRQYKSMTRQELQEKILTEIQRRDELAQKAQSIYRGAAEADHAYELAHARAFLKIREGTVPEKQAEALLLVADEKLTRKLAEAEAVACKDRLRAYESTISALQSLLKLEVMDYDAAKYGRTM